MYRHVDRSLAIILVMSGDHVKQFIAYGLIFVDVFMMFMPTVFISRSSFREVNLIGDFKTDTLSYCPL